MSSAPIGFTAVVPAYNRAALIGETLDAILAQTHAPREVIVIDDGSTDGTDEVVRRYGGVRFIRIENSGPAVARQAGLDAVATPWAAFCDSDDIWYPDHLAGIAAAIAAHPAAEFVFTNFCNFATDPRDTYFDQFASAPEGWWARFGVEAGDGRRIVADAFSAFLTFTAAWPSNSAVSMAKVARAGRSAAEASRMVSEDAEATLRFALDTEVVAVERITVALRKHGGNRSADYVRTLVGRSMVILSLLGSHPGLVRGREPAILAAARTSLLDAYDHMIWTRDVIGAAHLAAFIRRLGLRGFDYERIAAVVRWLAPLTRPLLAPGLRDMLYGPQSAAFEPLRR